MDKLTFKVEKDKDKLLKYLSEQCTGVSYASLQRALRKKDIVINNSRPNEDVYIQRGDTIVLYLSKAKQSANQPVDMIYEDENILVVNKPTGIEVVNEKGFDLYHKVLEHYSIAKSQDVQITPVHRLDRETRGLVIFAKNETSAKELLAAFKNRTIHKYYTATVQGLFPYKDSTKRAYLYKDSAKAKVYISDIKKPKYDEIITHFTLKKQDRRSNTSLLEIELITGKTHQIRAHLAHLGYPIIGDTKYNPNPNKKSIFNLTAQRIVFSFKPQNALYYLNGKQITLK